MADYLARIAESEERARELEAQLLDPEIARQAGEYQKLARALGGLRPLLEVGLRYREVIEQLEDSRAMLDDSDAELAELARAEVEAWESEHLVLDEKLADLLRPVRGLA